MPVQAIDLVELQVGATPKGVDLGNGGIRDGLGSPVYCQADRDLGSEQRSSRFMVWNNRKIEDTFCFMVGL